MDIPSILATAGVVSSIGMGLYLRVARQRDMALRDLELRVRAHGELLAKLEAITVTQAPFFTSLQSRVIDLLHHPDAASGELDALLERLKALTLTADELARLETILRTQADDPVVERDQRQHSRALLALMPLVVEEAKEHGAASQREARIPVRPTLVTPNGLIYADAVAAAQALIATAQSLKALTTVTAQRVADTLHLSLEPAPQQPVLR